MNIILNGKTIYLENKSLDQVLTELGYECPSIATAVNGAFVPADDRRQTILRDDDRLEVLSPMQGG